MEPIEVRPDEIRAARERIGAYVRRTPVLELEPGAFGLPCRVTLKLELMQHTGSFKTRGAFNKLLASDVPAVGVIAASGGNFGLAVAYAARTLGHRAEIFVPSTSPKVKAERIRSLGAEVRIVEGYYDEALEASRGRAEETGALVMHAYDQPEVVAGQGSIGGELSEQVPGTDTVLVAIGGGGLIGGIGAWYEGRTTSGRRRAGDQHLHDLGARGRRAGRRRLQWVRGRLARDQTGGRDRVRRGLSVRRTRRPGLGRRDPRCAASALERGSRVRRAGRRHGPRGLALRRRRPRAGRARGRARLRGERRSLGDL
jgi:Pyridoxal-phosphate dependent enzyme